MDRQEFLTLDEDRKLAVRVALKLGYTSDRIRQHPITGQINVCNDTVKRGYSCPGEPHSFNGWQRFAPAERLHHLVDVNSGRTRPGRRRSLSEASRRATRSVRRVCEVATRVPARVQGEVAGSTDARRRSNTG